MGEPFSTQDLLHADHDDVKREWRDNLFHGFGVYKYKNGDVYEVIMAISSCICYS